MEKSTKTGIIPLALFSLLLASLVFVYVVSEKSLSLSITSITQKFNLSKPSLLPNTLTYRDELDVALEGASMENKTVIIAIVNKAYTEGDKPMLDIFSDGFWLGEDTRQLIKHLLIVAVDETAFERCKFLGLQCYKLKTDGDLVSEKVYMSKEFINMMWQRTNFLIDVLRRGYNFVFTDTDVLWLRNPFPGLILNETTIDLHIGVDKFNGNQWSDRNPINTGFYMIRSNNKTIALFEEWYGQRNNSVGKKEQDVLVDLMRHGAFRRLGLTVRFLDTIYFSGFCQDSRDVSVVSTVHANCCKGIKAKVPDLIDVIHDWKRFNDPSQNITTDFRWSRHFACENSWRS